jgi:hypothetical protein
VLDLLGVAVSGPDEELGDGRRVVRRVLVAVDPAVVPGLGLTRRQESRRRRDRRVVVVQAELEDSTPSWR